MLLFNKYNHSPCRLPDSISRKISELELRPRGLTHPFIILTMLLSPAIPSMGEFLEYPFELSRMKCPEWTLPNENRPLDTKENEMIPWKKIRRWWRVDCLPNTSLIMKSFYSRRSRENLILQLPVSTVNRSNANVRVVQVSRLNFIRDNGIGFAAGRLFTFNDEDLVSNCRRYVHPVCIACIVWDTPEVGTKT